MFKLEKGDKVGIIAPSDLVNPEDIKSGIKYLEKLGLTPIFGKTLFSNGNFIPNLAKLQADDINSFYSDKSIKAMIAVRGGAGSQKILEYLEYQIIKQNPKPIIGFSDLTAIQLGIYAKTKQISFSGPMIIYDFSSDSIPPITEESFQKIIHGKKQHITSGETLIKGQSEGILIGGCLSLLRNLFGTEYMPSLKNKILFLEDVGEKTYKIDLILDQLKKQKHFDLIKGIIFCKFSDCELKIKEDGNIDEIIDAFCKDLNIPIIKNFEYGHIKNRYHLPIGKKAKLSATNCSLIV